MNGQSVSPVFRIAVGNERNCWRVPQIIRRPNQRNHGAQDHIKTRKAEHQQRNAANAQRDDLKNDLAAGHVHHSPTAEISEERADMQDRHQ